MITQILISFVGHSNRQFMHSQHLVSIWYFCLTSYLPRYLKTHSKSLMSNVKMKYRRFFLYLPFQFEILLEKLNFVQDFEVGNASCDWRLHKTCSVNLSQYFSLFFPSHLNERKLSICYLLFINLKLVAGKTSTVLIWRFKSNEKVSITRITSMPRRNASSSDKSRLEMNKYLVHCIIW